MAVDLYLPEARRPVQGWHVVNGEDRRRAAAKVVMRHCCVQVVTITDEYERTAGPVGRVVHLDRRTPLAEVEPAGQPATGQGPRYLGEGRPHLPPPDGGAAT
jgi:hypothetical protein